MAGWHIGVIGGSGLYEAGALDDAQQIAVASPFGEPSGPVTMPISLAVLFAPMPLAGSLGPVFCPLNITD